MKSVPKISDTEWEVMRVLWAEPNLTSSQIVERLTVKDPSWHPKTARTLINRLVEKKALEYEERGRLYVFRPLVSAADCEAAASGNFVERVFGGALKPMLVHFIEQKRLTKRDLEELRALLDEKKAGQGRKGDNK